eukprot:762822-Hanusia_phi.AAC.9
MLMLMLMLKGINKKRGRTVEAASAQDQWEEEQEARQVDEHGMSGSITGRAIELNYHCSTLRSQFPRPDLLERTRDGVGWFVDSHPDRRAAQLPAPRLAESELTQARLHRELRKH